MQKTIGIKLREMRLQKKLSLEDAAHKTRISLGHLRALEEGDYSFFTNLTYAKSFLKIYSDFLQIDTDSFTDEFGRFAIGDLKSPDCLHIDSEDSAYACAPIQKRKPIPLFLIFTILALFLSVFILITFTEQLDDPVTTHPTQETSPLSQYQQTPQQNDLLENNQIASNTQEILSRESGKENDNTSLEIPIPKPRVVKEREPSEEPEFPILKALPVDEKNSIPKAIPLQPEEETQN